MQGCGLTFASFTCFGISIMFFFQPTPLLRFQVKKLEILRGKMFNMHHELHSIGFRFCTTLIGLILFFCYMDTISNMYESLCACTTFQYIKFCRKSFDVLWNGFTLTPPHYPVIKIKCMETKHTTSYMDTM